jgi:hypothetical protein
MQHREEEDDRFPEFIPILVRQTHDGDDLNWIWMHRHKHTLYKKVVEYFYSVNFDLYATRLTLKNRNAVKKIRCILQRYCNILRRRKIEDIFKRSNMSEVRFIISNYIV